MWVLWAGLSLAGTPLAVSVVPPIAYPAEADTEVTGLSLNLLAGRRYSLIGVEAGLGYNREDSDAFGLQLSGGLNRVGGRLGGLQLAGLLNVASEGAARAI